MSQMLVTKGGYLDAYAQCPNLTTILFRSSSEVIMLVELRLILGSAWGHGPTIHIKVLDVCTSGV